MQVINNYELRIREVPREELPEYYGTRLITSADCGELARVLIGDKTQEHFIVFLLNLRQEVIGYQTVAMGKQEMCLVDMRVLFRGAIKVGASFLVVSHNHPEGDPTPSNQDLNVTDLVALGGEVLGIPLLDHIVVSRTRMFSMKTAGLLRKMLY